MYGRRVFTVDHQQYVIDPVNHLQAKGGDMGDPDYQAAPPKAGEPTYVARREEKTLWVANAPSPTAGENSTTCVMARSISSFCLERQAAHTATSILKATWKLCFPLVPFLVKSKFSWARQFRLGALLLGMPRTRSQRIGRAAVKLQGRQHSRERDRQAVAYHYNVSNDFFRLFLDERMVYTCAYFESADTDLDCAQERKLDYTCRKLRLRPGERLLDIGCGWGALLMHAAQHYGTQGLGVTLSEPQAQLANSRIRSAGLGDLCLSEVMNYRDVQEHGSFDKLVSIGMVEHVGAEMLPEYFAKAFKLLRPGGVFLNHGIARASSAQAHNGPTFVDRYVFPDGDIPPIENVLREAGSSGFEVRDVENLREHYVLTLRHWVRNLENHAGQARQATDESTYRTWRLYMAGSAHFFETGQLNDSP